MDSGSRPPRVGQLPRDHHSRFLPVRNRGLRNSSPAPSKQAVTVKRIALALGFGAAITILPWALRPVLGDAVAILWLPGFAATAHWFPFGLHGPNASSAKAAGCSDLGRSLSDYFLFCRGARQTRGEHGGHEVNEGGRRGRSLICSGSVSASSVFIIIPSLFCLCPFLFARFHQRK